MIGFTEIITITLILESCVCLLAFYRNLWVYRKRIELLSLDIQEYDKLESYDYMLNNFLIWDIEKFKVGKK